MSFELLLALFIIAVGLSLAGVSAHLYQFIWRTPVMLSYSGRTYLASLGNLFVSFVCGPYIMLKLGISRIQLKEYSFAPTLLASLIAFGWAFITGLLFMSLYLMIAGN